MSFRTGICPFPRFPGPRPLAALLIALLLALPAAAQEAAQEAAKPDPAKPDPVTTVPVTLCIQRGLQKAGHSPRGLDGVLGPRTTSAASAWARKAKRKLPALTAETAPRWCAALLAATKALPETAEGSARYCNWFAETLNGVWLAPDGTPVLRFRFGSQPGGGGCYAWLNPVPAWYVDGPGTQIVRVTREGALRTTGDDKNGMAIDVKTGLARYLRGGYTTTGVILAR